MSSSSHHLGHVYLDCATKMYFTIKLLMQPKCIFQLKQDTMFPLLYMDNKTYLVNAKSTIS